VVRADPQSGSDGRKGARHGRGKPGRPGDIDGPATRRPLVEIYGPTVQPNLPLLFGGQAIAPDGQVRRSDPDLGLMRYGGGGWRVVAPRASALAMAPDGVLWYQPDRGIERIQTNEFGN